MNIISLKDYAAQKNISYEAVRQQVVRYKDELNGHLIRDGRQQFLDEEAVAFLDAKRQKNPVAIIQQDKNEQIKVLEEEVKQLLVKTAAQADEIVELTKWKAEKSMLLEGAEQNRIALEEKTKEINILEGFIQDAKNEIDQLSKEKEESMQKSAVEIATALRRAEEAEHKLAQEQSRKLSFLERLTGKKQPRLDQ